MTPDRTTELRIRKKLLHFEENLFFVAIFKPKAYYYYVSNWLPYFSKINSISVELFANYSAIVFFTC